MIEFLGSVCICVSLANRSHEEVGAESIHPTLY